MPETTVDKLPVIDVAAGQSKKHPHLRRMHLDNLTQDDQELVVAFLQALQNGRDKSNE